MNASLTGIVPPPLAPTQQRTDSKPWYRQFWPWFLIALPATSVVFSFATLYIAVRDADEVVPHEGDSTSYSAPSQPGQAANGEETRREAVVTKETVTANKVTANEERGTKEAVPVAAIHGVRNGEGVPVHDDLERANR